MFAVEQGREAFVSNSGERFPRPQGIPAFLKPEDLTGDNGKYNHLYEPSAVFTTIFSVSSAPSEAWNWTRISRTI